MEWGRNSNPTIKEIMDKLATTWKKDRIIWIGDYTEDGDVPGFPTKSIYENVPTQKGAVEYRARNNPKKGFLINHSKGIFISMDRYVRAIKFLSKETEWIPSPLALLTACSNGRGGGDYHGINNHLVGYWAADSLEYSMEEPKSYEEVLPLFIEFNNLRDYDKSKVTE